MAPAVVGGVVAWGTRSAGGRAVDRPAGPGGPKPPTVVGVRAEARSGGTIGDGALSEQRQFCERLRGASFEQMTAMLDEAQALTDAFRRRSVTELVFEQLARTDPLKAWAFVETWKHAAYRHDFLMAWGAVDAVGALTWAEGQGEAGAGHVRSLVAGLLPDDVEGFAAILPRLKPEQMDESQMATAFRVLAAGDSARARELLDGLAPGTTRNAAASAMAEGWARGQPKDAYAWARDLTDPAQRESALRGVFRAWAESDPQGVAAKLDELAKDEPKDENGKSTARGDSPTRAIVRAWAAQDPMAAAAWLRDRSIDGDASFKQLFATEILSTRDEWSATEVAGMVRRPGEKLVTDTKDRLYNSSVGWGDEDGMYHIIGKFGGFHSPLGGGGPPGETPAVRFADPAGAFEELARQPGDASRQHLLQEVASQWARQDPAAALAKLRETTDEFLKLGLINALGNVARQTSDPALAAEVGQAFPESNWRRDSIVSEVYERIAQQDPDRARELLAGDLEPSARKALVSSLATQQAAYDPVGAVAWASQQPDEALQASAARSAVGRWAEADAYAVSEWLAAQPAGPVKQAATQALVGALQENAPEEALQWAATLTDASAREQEQRNIIQNQAHRDPARARQMAEEIPFSTEARENLKQMIDMMEKHRF
jgi:hypothetical protein